jgi:hypothetical protein
MRTWDCIDSHDAVAILLLNTDTRAFHLVRQFRPPVHLKLLREACAVGPDATTAPETIDTVRNSGHSTPYGSQGRAALFLCATRLWCLGFRAF